MKKDNISFDKAYHWFNENFNLEQDSDVLMSFSSGLISKSGRDNVNPENCEKVGVEIQTALDGLSFVEKNSTKQKVTNLASLKKPIKVNNKDVVIDALKLFTRLA